MSKVSNSEIDKLTELRLEHNLPDRGNHKYYTMPDTCLCKLAGEVLRQPSSVLAHYAQPHPALGPLDHPCCGVYAEDFLD